MSVAHVQDPLEEFLAIARGQLDRNEPAAARDTLGGAVRLAPPSAEAHYLLALAHLRLNDKPAAELSVRTAAEINPRHAFALHILGVLIAERGAHEEALPWLRMAVGLNPDNAQMQRDFAAVATFMGETADARLGYLRAVELDVTSPAALYNGVLITRMGEDTPEAKRFMNVLASAEAGLATLPERTRIETLFALAKAREERGEPKAAWDALARGNAAKRALVTVDIEGQELAFRRIAEVFDAPFLARLAGEGSPSKRPVFIFGMPRSGTTLVEQILGAHPQTHCAGETVVMPNLINGTRGPGGSPFPEWGATLTGDDVRLLAAAYLSGLPTGPGAQVRTTDKRLDNFMLAGLIHAMLPNAVLIHCRRDPRDVAFACLSMLFADGQEWSYSLEGVARFWRAQEALMAHWKAILPPGCVLEAPYEEIVADFEPWARRIVAHAGLDWDPACLEFYKARRAVTSASFAQVREPIYDRSIGRWKPFAKQLAPMFEMMGIDV